VVVVRSTITAVATAVTVLLLVAFFLLLVTAPNWLG
jgi:hypothetical protein